jgi:hypothetical protein
MRYECCVQRVAIGSVSIYLVVSVCVESIRRRVVYYAGAITRDDRAAKKQLLPAFARAAAFVADSGWSSGAPVSGAAKARTRFVNCSFKEAKTV